MKQTVIAFRRVHKRRFSNPVAVVVSRPADFGTVRTWDVYLQEIFPVRNIFYTVSKALEWLAGEQR